MLHIFHSQSNSRIIIIILFGWKEMEEGNDAPDWRKMNGNCHVADLNPKQKKICAKSNFKIFILFAFLLIHVCEIKPFLLIFDSDFTICKHIEHIKNFHSGYIYKKKEKTISTRYGSIYSMSMHRHTDCRCENLSDTRQHFSSVFHPLTGFFFCCSVRFTTLSNWSNCWYWFCKFIENRIFFFLSSNFFLFYGHEQPKKFSGENFSKWYFTCCILTRWKWKIKWSVRAKMKRRRKQRRRRKKKRL